MSVYTVVALAMLWMRAACAASLSPAKRMVAVAIPVKKLIQMNAITTRPREW